MSTVFALDELGVFARMGGLYIVFMGLARTVRALRVCQGAWPQNFGAQRVPRPPTLNSLPTPMHTCTCISPVLHWCDVYTVYTTVCIVHSIVHAKSPK